MAPESMPVPSRSKRTVSNRIHAMLAMVSIVDPLEVEAPRRCRGTRLGSRPAVE